MHQASIYVIRADQRELWSLEGYDLKEKCKRVPRKIRAHHELIYDGKYRMYDIYRIIYVDVHSAYIDVYNRGCPHRAVHSDECVNYLEVMKAQIIIAIINYL